MEDLRHIANMKADVNGITFITQHVTNNLLAHRWPSMLSERAVYTDTELCLRIKLVLS
jgi:hypothetical protein